MRIEEIKIGQEYWVPAHLTRTCRNPEKYPVFKVFESGEAGMGESVFKKALIVDAENLCQTEEEARKATRKFEVKIEEIENAKEHWFANAGLTSRLLFSHDLRKLDLELRYGRCPKVLLNRYWDDMRFKVSYRWNIEWEEGHYSGAEIDEIFTTKEKALSYIEEKKKKILEDAEEAIARWKATEIEEKIIF